MSYRFVCLWTANLGKIVLELQKACAIKAIASRVAGGREAEGLGLLWGWLPCGLVYGILATALLSGNALDGAAILAAFGVGTVPNLLLAGFAMRGVAARLQMRPVRMTAGALVLGFGVYGLAHAAALNHQIRGGLICF